MFTALDVDFRQRIVRLDKVCEGARLMVCMVAEHPVEYDQWNVLHVFDYMRCMTVLAPSLMTEEAQYRVFTTGALAVSASSSEEDIQAAWRHHREFLQLIGIAARHYEIIGNTNAHQLEMERKMRHIIHFMHATFEVLCCRALLRGAIRGAGALDGEGAYTCPYYYREVSADTKTNAVKEIVLFILMRAQQARLRRSRDLVCAPKTVEAYTWRPPPDSPLCRVPGCARLACFGRRRDNVRRWCEEHGPGAAAADVARRNGEVYFGMYFENNDDDRDDERKADGDGDGDGDDDGGGAGADAVPGFEAAAAAAAAVVDLRRNDRGVLLAAERDACIVDTQTWLPIVVPWTNNPLTVREWVAGEVDRKQNEVLWTALMENYTQRMKHIETYFREVPDGAFPFLVPDKHFISFRNGIFNTRTVSFTPYGSTTTYSAPAHEIVDGARVAGGGAGGAAAGRLPPNKCCVNYVDEDFDPNWCIAPLDSPAMQVDGFTRILTDQGFDAEMCSFFYAMLGRLFFRVKELDKWDKLMVIKGAGGSGKSTITNALAKLLGRSNIAVIPSNCEPQYALANVDGKALWMCMELRADFRLDNGVLQSMVSGDMTAIHQKFKDQHEVTWTVPGLLVGNALPVAWSQDTANAMGRRIIMFLFENFVKCDPSVAKSVMNNVAKLAVVAVREYQRLVLRLGERDLDEALPLRMRESAAAFKVFANPALQFIQGSAELELASEDDRRAMIVYLIDEMGVKPSALRLAPERISAIRRELGPTAHGAEWKRAMQHMLSKYHVTMDRMHTLWTAAATPEHGHGGARNRPSIKKPEVYEAASVELLVPVLDAVTVRLKGGKKSQVWIGIRECGQRVDDGDDDDDHHGHTGAFGMPDIGV